MEDSNFICLDKVIQLFRVAPMLSDFLHCLACLRETRIIPFLTETKGFAAQNEEVMSLLALHAALFTFTGKLFTLFLILTALDMHPEEARCEKSRRDLCSRCRADSEKHECRTYILRYKPEAKRQNEEENTNNQRESEREADI